MPQSHLRTHSLMNQALINNGRMATSAALSGCYRSWVGLVTILPVTSTAHLWSLRNPSEHLVGELSFQRKCICRKQSDAFCQFPGCHFILIQRQSKLRFGEVRFCFRFTGVFCIERLFK